MIPVFMPRASGSSTATPVAITITGTGKNSYCYAIINGTTYTAATTDIEVYTGDIISFCAGTTSSSYTADITIDGNTIASGSSCYHIYDWTVPSGISAITITLSCSTTASNNRITVTTS